MKPTKHLLTSSVLGAMFYLYSKSFLASFICFLSGILIDLDHFCDFFFHNRKLSLNLKKFYLDCTDCNFSKLYLFLHSLELLFLLWISIIIFKLNLIWIAIAVGTSFHILLDIMGNNFYTLAYFLIYRVYKGFKPELLFKDAGKNEL